MNPVKLFRFTTAALLVAAVSFTGCSQDSPTAVQTVDSNVHVLSKKGKPGGGSQTSVTYPQYTEETVMFSRKWNKYGGRKIELGNASSFLFPSGALTPPSGHKWSSPVTITWQADFDSIRKELFFTFGPSGCSFDPPAEVWFNYEDLGTSDAKLYYVDAKGQYFEEAPVAHDVRGKRMKVLIKHFSRYAIGQP